MNRRKFLSLAASMIGALGCQFGGRERFLPVDTSLPVFEYIRLTPPLHPDAYAGVMNGNLRELSRNIFVPKEYFSA